MSWLVKFTSLFFLIVLLGCNKLIAQDIRFHIDSLNARFDGLLQKDYAAAGRLADSITRKSQEQEFTTGVLSGNLLTAKYLRKVGEYDSASNLILLNIEGIKAHLPLVSEEFQFMLSRIYGVSYYELSVISFYQGDYDGSLNYTFKSDSIQDYFFKNNKTKQNLYLGSKRNAKMLRGNIYYVKGEIDRAIVLFQEGAIENEEAQNYYNAAVTYQNLGTLYKDKGQLIEAIKALNKAQNITEKNEYAGLKASVLGATGQVFYSMRDYREALNYSLKANRLHFSLNDRFGIAFTSADVGDNFKKLGQIDSAVYYYEKSLALHEEMGNVDDVAYVLERLAGLNSENESCDKALIYIKRALEVIKGNNLPEERLLINVVLAECQLKSGNYKDAKSTVFDLLEMADQTENVSHKKDIYQVAHKMYSKLGDYEKAYSFFEKYLLHRDSIYTDEKSMEVARVEYEYELERETSRLENEQAKQELIFDQQLDKQVWIRNTVIVIGVLILFAALLAIRAYKIKKITNMQLAERNRILSELRQREQQLSAETLASKDRELATMAMASHEKNSLLKNLEQKVSFIESRIGDEMKSSVKEMRKTISDGFSLDKSWDSFLHRFEDVHPQFFDRLKEENPSLSVDDLKLSAYLKIGMSNKEIANVTHLTLGSIKSKINRLKKKLEMTPEDSVRDYMLRYA